jgi:hypothetical protein
MKIKNYTAFLLVIILGFTSCKKDDDPIIIIPENNRTEQQIIDNDSLLGYLETHYFNASTFDTPGNYKMSDLVITELPKNESGDYLALPDPDNNTLLIDAVETKTTTFLETEYTYYILRISQGGGAQPKFTDNVKINYSGNLMNEDVFDSTVNPTVLDLVNVIVGWRKIIPNFQTAVGLPTISSGGIEQYDNYGFGVMFLPSGLAYYSSPPFGIPVYSNLIFRFQLYQSGHNDHDGDGIPSHLEDLNVNENVFDDDTDGDKVPNFLDANDDGDSIITRNEIKFNTYTVDTNQGEQEPVLASNEYEVSRSKTSGVITIKTVVLTDTTNDGTPDYLDKNTAISS